MYKMLVISVMFYTNFSKVKQKVSKLLLIFDEYVSQLLYNVNKDNYRDREY